jgi:hypothetical protein
VPLSDTIWPEFQHEATTELQQGFAKPPVNFSEPDPKLKKRLISVDSGLSISFKLGFHPSFLAT